MDDRVKKAFDYAADLTKQLITLSTVILGAMVTFMDKAALGTKIPHLYVALVAYFLSIISGILTLMALTGTIAQNANATTPYVTNVRWFSGIQILLFLLATGFAIFVAGR